VTSSLTAPTAEPGSAADGPLLELRGLVKRFGQVLVLDGVSLIVRPGTVHALLGGNGSGKSTTIKILAGVYQADAGELRVRGEPVDLIGLGPEAADRLNLRFVHQDLGLFDDLSIAENFALASGYPTRSGGVDWRRLNARVDSLIAAYGINGTPRSTIQSLRPADRTLVAIARALQDDESGRSIVVLDEPTASLGRRESAQLLETVRRRAAQGQTFIIVSHRLQEVLAVADDFTVYRDGQVAAALVGESPTEDQLVSLMAGRAVTALAPTGSTAHSHSEPLLALEGIMVGPLRDVDLVVHRGEIVGIAGLSGSGRSTVLAVAFGRLSPHRGRMTLDDRPFAPSSVRAAMDAGIALVPEDRAREAAFADLSITENLTIAVPHQSRRAGFIRAGLARRHATDLIERFRIKIAGPDALFASMSGGNQQKTVIARWLQRSPRVLLLDEPTQGVDVMSRSDIYDIIRNSTGTQNAVVVASSDLGELHALCDRIVILADGRVVHDVPTETLSIDALTALVLTSPKNEEGSFA